MAWEDIENETPIKTHIPPNGLTVGTRAAGRQGKLTRYIGVTIGANLAKAIALSQERHMLRLRFGTGDDSGKIAVNVDQQKGKFEAARQKSGSYRLTIRKNAAEGLFSVDFPVFVIEKVDVQPAKGSEPPFFVFEASEAMLNVDD